MVVVRASATAAAGPTTPVATGGTVLLKKPTASTDPASCHQQVAVTGDTDLPTGNGHASCAGGSKEKRNLLRNEDQIGGVDDPNKLAVSETKV